MPDMLRYLASCGAIGTVLAANPAWPADDTLVRVFIPERFGRLTPEAPLKGDWSQFFAGDSWVGIYCGDGKGCESRRVRITTRRVRAMNCDGKSKLGSAVSFVPLGPVFVTNLPSVRPGKLHSSFYDIAGKEIPSGFSEGWRIDTTDGKATTLTIPKNVIRNDACWIRRGVPIILREDRRKTRWTRVACRVDSFPSEFLLHWLGDVDADGKTDVLMSFPDGTQSLMLSSSRNTRIETTQPELIGAGC